VARFEDRLWNEIVEQHGGLLAQAPARAPVRPRRLRRRAPLAAIGLALAAGLAALVIGVGRNAGTSAYAVVANPDGTVTVTIRELEGVAPANRRLTMLGVPVRIAAVTADCPAAAHPLKPAPLPLASARRAFEFEGPPGEPSARVDPAAIPKGDTLLLSAAERRPGIVSLRGLVIEGEAPPCRPPGPGE
jgi:hypothetical protein